MQTRLFDLTFVFRGLTSAATICSSVGAGSTLTILDAACRRLPALPDFDWVLTKQTCHGNVHGVVVHLRDQARNNAVRTARAPSRAQ